MRATVKSSDENTITIPARFMSALQLQEGLFQPL